MKQGFLNILLVLTLLVTVYVRFYPNHFDLPKGCDEFGYLQLADAISENITFNEHTPRNFLDELIPYLQKKGYTNKDYSWIVGPHAYHYNQDAKKVMNQYPPGTSLLLTALPKSQRQFLFPIVVLALFVPLFWLFKKYNHSPAETELLFTSLLLLSIIFIITSPFLTEFTNVNSVSPTFALLIFAGVFIATHPKISLLLIAISINFRIANSILVPFFMLYYFNSLAPLPISQRFKKLIPIALLSFLVAFGVYGLYTYKLIGIPFASTYSEIDQRSIDLSLLTDNILYYLDFKSSWFLVNLTSYLIILALFLKKAIKKNAFVLISSSLFFTYLFFFFHAAKTPYYPYAIGMIMIGFLLHTLSEKITLNQVKLTYAKGAILIVLLVVISSHASKFNKFIAKDTAAEKALLNNCFSDYDVVWGDLKISTIEYAIGKPGMRFFWGNEQLRLDVMKWLANHNYRQIIYLNDLISRSEEVNRFIEDNDMHFMIVEDKGCGILIELHP